MTFTHFYFKTILIICLATFGLGLAIVCHFLDQEIINQKMELASLISEIAKLKEKIFFLEEKIKSIQDIRKTITPVLVDSNIWCHNNIVKLICISCILSTFIGTKLFFAYTPYLLNYTAQSWNFKIISYFYPVIWAPDQAPKIYKDSVKNLFRLVYDTNLDTFVLDAQLWGTTKAISIAEFIQWALS